MSDEKQNLVVENNHVESNDLLCGDCDEALSDFLQDMAYHNAKVTACPKCGKNHPLRPPQPAPSSESGFEAA